MICSVAPRLRLLPFAALASVLFVASAGGLRPAAADSTTVFNEIMYHPAEPGAPEWIELRNLMAVDMDLSRWKIRGGIDFDFPVGTIIPARGHLVVSGDPGSLEAATGLNGILGPWSGSLSNGGEALRLINNSGRTMDEIEFGDGASWPAAADGAGATLAKRTAHSAGSDPVNWTSSPRPNGSPGSENFPTGDTTGPEVVLIDVDAGWTYNESGAALPAGWQNQDYAAGTGGWKAGDGVLAFEDGPLPAAVMTVLADPSSPPVTTHYFQTSFAFQGNPAAAELRLDLLVDDGAVVYLNGQEVARINMPEGAVDSDTFAESQIGNTVFTGPLAIPAEALIQGTNRLSIEVHQAQESAPVVVVGGDGGLALVEEGGTMDAPNNLALAGTAFAKDLLGNGSFRPTHDIPHINNGTYGNSSSWIGDSANSFCGISFGTNPVTVGSIAFGRDNSGQFTDRSLGLYTIQFTRVPNPGAATAETGNPSTGWDTIGTLDYQSAGGANFSQPHRRHLYRFDQVSATGIRLIAPGNGISSGAAIDELELYGPEGPDVVLGARLTVFERLTAAGEIPVVINEISGAFDETFRVELRNSGGVDLDVGGFVLDATGDAAPGHVLPAGTVIPAGGFLVLSEQELGFRPGEDDIVGLYSVGRSFVTDAARVADRARARSADHDGRLLVPSAPSFGAANMFSIEDAVVINEIMYAFRDDPGTIGIPPVATETVLVPIDATWRYNESGANLGTGWATAPHPVDNVQWFEGPAILGSETTPAALPEPLRTEFAPSSGNGIVTYYFEIDFTLTDTQLAALDELSLRHIIDDGAVFHLNGSEVLRFNMPDGPISASTLASAGVGNGRYEGPFTLPLDALVAGTNRLSVEVHQQTAGSSDIVFAAALTALETLDPGEDPVPVVERDEEWVELFNRGTVPVDLGGWSLDGGIDFDFPAGATIAPGGFVVIARDAEELRAKYPEIGDLVVGSFRGNLRNSRDRFRLEDANGNPVDEVAYFDGGAWPALADGGGSSLELRDPDADNANGAAWAASDESAKSEWQTIRYRMTGGQAYGLTEWNEFRLGMLQEGEVLIDDVSVVQDPDGTPRQLIQNGTFETSPGESKWRIIGNHRHSTVVPEPGNPGNRVLHLVATGATDTRHNHLETTFSPNTALSANQTYEVSFRARWLAGSNQLNSRAYYQRLARTTQLDRPERCGSPGRPNSRLEPNIGPTASGLSHSPAVPDPGQPVTVTINAADPDGVQSLTLRYAVNGGAAAAAAMTPTGGGRFSGVIPGQAAGAVVQFYVECRDAAGAVSFAPAAGPDSRALFQAADGRGTDLPLQVMRLVMLPQDRDFMLQTLNLMSNERLGGTVVYNGDEIFYDVQVRLRGSGAGRARDGDAYQGYNIDFPPDHLFRGVQDSIGIDRSSRTPGVGRQDEIYVKHMFNQAGIPCMYDDLVYFIPPRTAHTGRAILMMARYGGLFAESQFENGGNGSVFNLDITYDPVTTVDGNPESLKPPVPFRHIGTDFADLGDDKEGYRSPFEIRTGRRRDDYSGLIRFCQTMDLPTQELEKRIGEVMDVDEWMRYTALTTLCGIGDTFVQGGLRHNIRVYVPEDGRGVVALPWDMDFVFSSPTSASMLAATGNLRRVISIPKYQRLYWGHVQDLVNRTFNTGYMNRWLQHYGEVSGHNFSAQAGYISQRAAFALSQLPANVPFSITTNGGADFSVADTKAILQGRGWINIREFRLQGSEDPLPAEWLDDDTWEVTIPLLPGANPLGLEIYDFAGNLLATRNLTITSTITDPTPYEFLRITEIHYHPADPSTPAELAASTNDNDFEFIELRNIGTQPLDISGVRFTDGIDFTFPPATTLAPAEFIVAVRHRAAFEARYGPVPRVAGEFAPTNLDNAGETIELRDAPGNVIHRFTYSDTWHPATDGGGPSLVTLDENADRAAWGSASHWQAGTTRHGTPGRGESGAATDFSGWQALHFTQAELLDPALSGPTGDLNRDGTPNLLKYAFAINPRSQNPPEGLVMIAHDGEKLTIAFRRAKDTSDLAFFPEVSSNLVGWTPLTTQPTPPIDHGDGTETVVFEDPVPLDGLDVRFARVRVELLVNP